MEKQIDISVITPFYKGNVYMQQLFACIRRNALAAPDIAVELVLVNDSPDCPIDYEQDWVEGFFLKVYENPKNLGIQRTRVNGLKQAKGAYVMFLDQDDLLRDDALLLQWQYSKDADIIVSNGYNENRDRKKPIYHSLAHQRQVANARFYLSVGCLIVSPGQCLIRSEAIPQSWKERSIDRNGADDYLLWLLLLASDCRWCINPEPVYIHVDTGRNLSADNAHMIRSSCEALALALQQGAITTRQDRLARRRFAMRQRYEGKSRIHKLLACLCYPDLFLELLLYTAIKKLCR